MTTKLDLQSPLAATMRVNGREVSYFCGTSYYVLHGHPAIRAAACAAIERYGMGAATIAGVEIYDQLKQRACVYFGVEAITYFASGYLSISVLLQALQEDFDIIFVDAVSHFSIFEAIRATGRPIVKFNHRDGTDLAAKLSTHAGQTRRPVIVTDGIFPSTGALAPLDEYAELMKSFPGSLLCIDDSHGVGVLGQKGRGSFDHFGLQGPQFLLAGTFSKAFGGFGGFVAGSRELAEKVARHAHLMVGASAPPIPAAAAAIEGLRLLGDTSTMRETLWQNVRHIRAKFADHGVPTADTHIPIISFEANSDLKQVAQALDARNLIVRYVPPHGYSDAPEKESLRIAVFSTHTHAQLDELAANLGELL